MLLLMNFFLLLLAASVEYVAVSSSNSNHTSHHHVGKIDVEYVTDLHVLWIAPQFIFLGISEVLVGLTGRSNFAFKIYIE